MNERRKYLKRNNMNTSDLQLRPAFRGESLELISIQTDALLEMAASHYSKIELVQWTSSLSSLEYEDAISEGEIVVAHRNNLKVGFGQYKKEWQEIKELYVKPSVARTGVGLRLALHLEECARVDKVKILRTFSSLNAVEFYRSCGFQPLERKELEVAKSLFLPFMQMEKALT